ncbi:hypothetical protein GCM10010389_37140 [Streptomyces echinoruber]|uniref:Uncharacterized protein n=1 Tax=Streptomyces echinoruber TaxID=68898 RepID=A0A918VFV5_9ACTN|nr:hypothetical protein GCM10010389_37140 [Streptomyces echinoruber]
MTGGPESDGLGGTGLGIAGLGIAGLGIAGLGIAGLGIAGFGVVGRAVLRRGQSFRGRSFRVRSFRVRCLTGRSLRGTARRLPGAARRPRLRLPPPRRRARVVLRAVRRAFGLLGLRWYLAHANRPLQLTASGTGHRGRLTRSIQHYGAAQHGVHDHRTVPMLFGCFSDLPATTQPVF